jgi:polar amino acid transport system substrate-binding protein
MRGYGASIDGAGGRLLAGAALVALMAGACGAGASPSAVPGPERVKEAGTLVTCTDMTNPPSASHAEDGTTPEGFDVDIAAEIARQLGVTSTFYESADFDFLIRDLRAGKCDLVLADMTSTYGDRAAQVDFVDYLRTWVGFLVAPGNPKGIRTTEDLAGTSVGVEATDYFTKAALTAASDDLVAAGKPAIEIVTTTKSGEGWVGELASGRIDALSGDSVEAVYDVDRPPYAGASEIGGPALDPQPIGIAIRKSDAGMKEAVAAAIDAMYADGKMKALVVKWGLTDVAELLK